MPIQQQVLGLQVSVNDVLGVQIFQCQSGLGSIEFGNRVWEPLGKGGSREGNVSNKASKLTPIDIISRQDMRQSE